MDKASFSPGWYRSLTGSSTAYLSVSKTAWGRLTMVIMPKITVSTTR